MRIPLPIIADVEPLPTQTVKSVLAGGFQVWVNANPNMVATYIAIMISWHCSWAVLYIVVDICVTHPLAASAVKAAVSRQS